MKPAPGGDQTVKIGVFLPHMIMNSLYEFRSGELFYSLMAGTPHVPLLQQYKSCSRAPLAPSLGGAHSGLHNVLGARCEQTACSGYLGRGTFLLDLLGWVEETRI